MTKQAPHSLLMIKPLGFKYNSDTSSSNAFQNKLTDVDVESAALKEFEEAIEKLKSHQISVLQYDNLSTNAPDAVFPNNWFSTHENGTIVLYPMLAKNRRIERRLDIISDLQNKFEVSGLIDLSEYESSSVFLEGTGSIIFDHDNGIAYAAESERTNLQLFNSFCSEMGFETISFLATDVNNKAIYHTNVVLSICSKFSILCSESIENQLERQMLIKQLSMEDRPVIEISFSQMKQFCANVLEVQDRDGNLVIVMSSTAKKAFTKDQLTLMAESHTLIDIDIPTIEKVGGGSARCMMAGLHLPIK